MGNFSLWFEIRDDHVHSGDGRVGDAAEREDMQAQSVEKSAFSPLKVM